MDFIQIKIEKDSSIAKYIKTIRKFDHSLPVGVIKQRIDENDFVMGFDLEYYDVLEDMNGIDRKKIFRDMLVLRPENPCANISVCFSDCTSPEYSA